MSDLLAIPINLNAHRRIIHVDMDAFFAQVEMLDNPEYRNVPLVLARDSRQSGGHGVVSTANYIARQYGIHSAMSAAEALRLAPDAVFVPPHFERYRELSNKVREIFQRVTEKIEPMSIDEAYLDITEQEPEFEDAIAIGHQLQQTIFDELGLTSSVGISYNKFLAKLGSEHNKPVGLTVVRPDDIRAFLDSLPIEEIRGVGKKTAVRMHELGIETGRDLYELKQSTLLDEFGKQGYEFYRRIRGVDDRPVEWQRERKSVGRERTYNPLLDTEEKVLGELRHTAEMLAESLERRHVQGKTLVLKIRTDAFETETRRQTFPTLMPNTPEYFYEQGQILLDDLGGFQEPLRLLGLTVTNLQDKAHVELLLPIFGL